MLVTGFVQIVGSKIQDFFQILSPNDHSFPRLKVIKLVINRDLTKRRNKAFFNNALQTSGRD